MVKLMSNLVDAIMSDFNIGDYLKTDPIIISRRESSLMFNIRRNITFLLLTSFAFL